MPDDVHVLLVNIAAGFQESLPEEIVTTLIFIAFVVGLVLYAVRTQRADWRVRRELREARYGRLIRSLDLPVGAPGLLDRLAKYLSDPSRRVLLLESEATFNSCLRKLYERETVSPALVAALRTKLRHRGKSFEKIPFTSADIAEQSIVVVERLKGEARVNRDGRIPARVVAVEPDRISLQMASDGEIARGDRIKLYFHNAAGLYMAPTRVVGRRNDLLEVSHSSSITSVQRRNYYRRKLTAPTFVRRVDTDERFVKSLLRDLGGGGARLVNPHCAFQTGDKLEIALDVGERSPLRVSGSVVRACQDGTISLQFDGLRESSRDLILRSLFKRYNAFLRRQRQEEVAIDQRAAPASPPRTPAHNRRRSL